MSIVVIILCLITFTYGSSSASRDQHECETEHTLCEGLSEADQHGAPLYRCSKWSTVHVKATCSRFLISSCAHANDICLKTKILWAVKVPCRTFVDRQRQAMKLLRLKVIEQTLRGRRKRKIMNLRVPTTKRRIRSATCSSLLSNFTHEHFVALHSFFYNNNFITRRASNLPKIQEQAKNKLRLTFFEH